MTVFIDSPRGRYCSATGNRVIRWPRVTGRLHWYLRELFEKLPLARTRADYLALLPTARPPPSSP